MRRTRIEITAIRRRTTLVVNNRSSGSANTSNVPSSQNFRAEENALEVVDPQKQIGNAGPQDEPLGDSIGQGQTS